MPGMCNPKNYSDSPATSKSTVEELHRPIPSLFRALTEGDAPINMMVVSFPVAEELSHHENLVSFLESLDNQHQNVSVPGNSIHASYDTQGNAWTIETIWLYSSLASQIHINPYTQIPPPVEVWDSVFLSKTSPKHLGRSQYSHEYFYLMLISISVLLHFRGRCCTSDWQLE